MHKYIAGVVVAVAVVVLVWLAWSRPDASAQLPVDAPQPAPATVPTIATLPTDAPAEAGRTEQPAPAEAPERRADPAADELWGRVVIAGTATPIAGADVQLLHCDGDEFWNLDLAYAARVNTKARAQSGKDGRFRFSVARARKHRLHVRAGGYAEVTVTACTGGSEVVIGLSRGASIEGMVRCESLGLSDIPVRIVVVGEGTELAAGRTEVSGAFRFTGLQSASVFVQVRSPRHSEAWKQLELRDGALHRAEIDLKPGRELRGRVIEATTRAPIVDAEVSDAWVFRRTVRTGADGSFRLAGLADRSFVPVYVRAAGYASASRNVAGQLDREVEFAMVRGGEVSGRFVTADGGMAREVYAAVGASYSEAPGMGGSDWIRADIGPDGRFLAVGLRPELHYWLYVRGPGYGSRVHALARKLASGERLDMGDIVLRAAGGVEGRVVDDSGEPLADMRVDLAGANADSRVGLSPEQKPQVVSQFESREGRSDRRGSFRFTSLAAGDYTVSVRPRGQHRTVSVQVAVSDGAITEGVELVVATGLVIDGVLRYADGRAIGDEAAELYMTAATADHARSSTRVEHGGRFRFAGLTEGSYTIAMMLAPPGWSLSPRQVAAGTKELQLVLDPSAYVTGSVVDAGGKGIKANVYAQLEGNTGGSALHATEADGTFRIAVPADFRGTVGAYDLRDWMLQAKVAGVGAGQTGIVLQLEPLQFNVPAALRSK